MAAQTGPRRPGRRWIEFGCFGHDFFGRAGHEALQEGTDLGLGEDADETINDLSVSQAKDGGNRPDSEG